MGKTKKRKLLVKYANDGTLTLNCTPLEAIGACYSILSALSRETGIEYNELVEDLKETKNQIGMIDLFDFNPKHKRAGIGILIDPAFQNKGFAGESLELLIKYTFSHLELHQLYANITGDNAKSIKLFESKNFTKVGVKKDWISSQGNFKDEILYQLIND